jgi:hypothetical protein
MVVECVFPEREGVAVKVRVPFKIVWGYAGPRGGPCRVRATLFVLRDPWKAYKAWAKAAPYQMTPGNPIFFGVKEGDKLIPFRSWTVSS